MSSMLGELPALGFELEVMRDERPVERCHPVGYVGVLVNPCLIICVMGGKLDGGIVMDVVVCVPVT